MKLESLKWPFAILIAAAMLSDQVFCAGIYSPAESRVTLGRLASFAYFMWNKIFATNF